MIKFCLNDLIEALDANSTIFVESDIVKDSFTSKSFRNTYKEKYVSATTLLQLADQFDKPSNKKLLKFGEDLQSNILTTGSIYFSSGVLFIIALEAILFTLYHQLIKDEFREDDGVGEKRIKNYFRNVTIKAGYEVRLGTMHLFCNGFRKPIIQSEDFKKRIRAIMKFRNNTFHGNLTEEHFIYAHLEDGSMFYYSPSTDYRGKAKENETVLPFVMSQMDKEVVEYIKMTVDDIIRNIELAMDENTRKWFKKVLDEKILPDTL